MKILVLMGEKIGDVLARIPLLRNLKENIKDCKVYVYANKEYPEGYALIKKIPYIDHIIDFDYRDTKKTLDFVFKYRKVFDYIIDTYPTTAKKALFTWLLNAKQASVGFNTTKLSFFYDYEIPVMKEKIVSLEAKILKNVFNVEISKNNNKLEYPYTISPDKYIDKLLKNNKINITIYTGPVFRSWPQNYWQKLINLIKTNKNIELILIGGRDCLWCDLKSIDHDLRGKLSLMQTSRLLQKTDIFLTSNAGPMWMAAAIGTQTIAIHGQSKYGWQPECDNVYNFREFECKYYDLCDTGRPCYFHGSEKYKCIKAVKVLDVYSQIKRMIHNE